MQPPRLRLASLLLLTLVAWLPLGCQRPPPPSPPLRAALPPPPPFQPQPYAPFSSTGIVIYAKLIELKNLNPQRENLPEPLIPWASQTFTPPLKPPPESALIHHKKWLKISNLDANLYQANPEHATLLTPEQAHQTLYYLTNHPDVTLLSLPPISLPLTQTWNQTSVQNSVTIVDKLGSGTPTTYGTDSYPTGPALSFTNLHLTSEGTLTFDSQTTLVEFQGYRDPGPNGKVPIKQPDGSSIQYVIPTPSIRIQKLDTSATLAPGQTWLVPGPISFTTNYYKSKVRYLGDLPLIGSLFQKNQTNITQNHLLLLLSTEP